MSITVFSNLKHSFFLIFQPFSIWSSMSLNFCPTATLCSTQDLSDTLRKDHNTWYTNCTYCGVGRSRHSGLRCHLGTLCLSLWISHLFTGLLLVESNTLMVWAPFPYYPYRMSATNKHTQTATQPASLLTSRQQRIILQDCFRIWGLSWWFVWCLITWIYVRELSHLRHDTPRCCSQVSVSRGSKVTVSGSLHVQQAWERWKSRLGERMGGIRILRHPAGTIFSLNESLDWVIQEVQLDVKEVNSMSNYLYPKWLAFTPEPSVCSPPLLRQRDHPNPTCLIGSRAPFMLWWCAYQSLPMRKNIIRNFKKILKNENMDKKIEKKNNFFSSLITISSVHSPTGLWGMCSKVVGGWG